MYQTDFHTQPRLRTPQSPPAAEQRWGAIDSARGIGIFLVVFGHAWRGAAGAGVLADTPLYRAVDFAIYAFHMPLFFFLSGLLFLDAVTRVDTPRFLRGRAARLLWPMALWTWLFFGLKWLAGDATNHPVASGDFPLSPLPPYEHLWFLWALFLVQALVFAVYRPLRNDLAAGRFAMFAGVAGIALALLNPFLSITAPLWAPALEHLPYFLIGIAAGVWRFWRAPPRLAVVAGIIFLGLIAGTLGHKAPVFVSALLLVAGWTAWSGVDNGALAPGGALVLLRRLGLASMAIYLTHTVFSAALRIIMLKAGMDDPVILLVATTLAGLALPLALLAVVRRRGLGPVLGF